MRRLWRRVDLPSAAFAAPPRLMASPMTTSTVAILTGSLVGRPVKNGDARLKHTATEKTAAVPVAEAESTKVLFRGAFRHREESLEKPPRGRFRVILPVPGQRAKCRWRESLTPRDCKRWWDKLLQHAIQFRRASSLSCF